MRYLLGLLGVVAIIVCHRPLLRLCASGLIVDSADGHADTILILDGDRCFEKAAEHYARGACDHVLLLAWQPDRLTMLGVLPSWDTIGRRELLAAGMPADAIFTTGGQVRNNWDAARTLDKWLDNNPQRRVDVFCHRFHSRELSHICNREIDSSRRARVHVRALSDRRYDETDWWLSKLGVKDFFGSVLFLGYAFARGEDPAQRVDLSPDRYEAGLFK